jgi:diaminopimelate decarboxylase
MAGGLADRILTDRFPESREVLVIGGLSAATLVERFGSPLYVFDAAGLRASLAAVRGALGPRVDVLYALKANPNAAVAQVLRRAGAGAEVASAGEILIALRAGFEGRQLQFAGPGKHGEDLRLALEHGVTLNLESAAELEAVAEAAARAGRRARVALRVNPPRDLAGARMRMGGGSAKFGIDAEAAPALAARAEALDGVELLGLHTYAGTQTFDHEGWLAHARFLLETAARVEAAIGRPLLSLNFGGGFGVPVFDGDPSFDLEAAGAGLQALIEADARPERRYFVELGRALVALAGVFLSRVVYVKESHGQRHAILDGGMHHHAAATGMGSVLRRSFPIVKATALRAPPAGPLALGGPLCTPADSFPPGAALPELAAGDLVGFLASGAYGLSFSSVLFLGHPTPAEVLVDGGEAWVVRVAGTPEDALRGQVLPPAAPAVATPEASPGPTAEGRR